MNVFVLEGFHIHISRCQCSEFMLISHSSASLSLAHPQAHPGRPAVAQYIRWESVICSSMRVPPQHGHIHMHNCSSGDVIFGGHIPVSGTVLLIASARSDQGRVNIPVIWCVHYPAPCKASVIHYHLNFLCVLYGFRDKIIWSQSDGHHYAGHSCFGRHHACCIGCFSRLLAPRSMPLFAYASPSHTSSRCAPDQTGLPASMSKPSSCSSATTPDVVIVVMQESISTRPSSLSSCYSMGDHLNVFMLHMEVVWIRCACSVPPAAYKAPGFVCPLFSSSLPLLSPCCCRRLPSRQAFVV